MLNKCTKFQDNRSKHFGNIDGRKKKNNNNNNNNNNNQKKNNKVFPSERERP